MNIAPIEIRGETGKENQYRHKHKQQKRIVRTLASLPGWGDEKHEESQKQNEKDKIFNMQKLINLKTESRKHTQHKYNWPQRRVSVWNRKHTREWSPNI